MTLTKPWRNAVVVVFFLFWAFFYVKHTFISANKANVVTIASIEATGANLLAWRDAAVERETTRITTTAHIAEALSESRLDRSAYEITKTPQILATSCATITPKRDWGEPTSAHISLETTPNGSVQAVAAPGRCPA